MSDNSRVLPDGFGAPYVWIKTTKGEDMKTSDLYGNEINLNQLITSFEYKYNEEDDDLCTIKFHMPHMTQMNHPLFREDQQLKVQWGYLRPGGDLKGPTRTIAVRDIESNYKSDGIEMEIICTDLVSYLRNVRLNRASVSQNFEAWIEEIISGEYIPSITIKGKTTILKTDKNKSNHAGIAGISNLHAVTGEDEIFWGKSKAILAEVEERLGQSTKGPLYADGRDNVLDIKDRNYDQAPYKYYTYMGGSGELIEFRAKSNILTSRDGEAEEGIINPVTKEVEKSRTAKQVGYGEDKQKFNRNSKEDNDKAWAGDNVKKDITERDEELVERIVNNKALVNLKKDFKRSVDNLANQAVIDSIGFNNTIAYGGGGANPINSMGRTSVYVPKYRVDYVTKKPAKQVLNSPHFLRARRVAVLNNYIMKKVERKYEASVKTMGDPSIISSKVYNFRNLSNRDSGSWYCTSVSHSITPAGGYVNTMEVLKKPTRLASLLEKRDEPLNELGPTDPYAVINYEEQNEVMKSYPEIGNSAFLNSDDITRRVNEQVAFSQTYYTNDVKVNNYTGDEGINMNVAKSRDV